MKRKRIDANATAAEQFDSLRNVKGLSDNTRREIISLYATSERCNKDVSSTGEEI